MNKCSANNQSSLICSRRRTSPPNSTKIHDLLRKEIQISRRRIPARQTLLSPNFPLCNNFLQIWLLRLTRSLLNAAKFSCSCWTAYSNYFMNCQRTQHNWKDYKAEALQRELEHGGQVRAPELNRVVHPFRGHVPEKGTVDELISPAEWDQHISTTIFLKSTTRTDMRPNALDNCQKEIHADCGVKEKIIYPKPRHPKSAPAPLFDIDDKQSPSSVLVLQSPLHSVACSSLAPWLNTILTQIF